MGVKAHRVVITQSVLVSAVSRPRLTRERSGSPCRRNVDPRLLSPNGIVATSNGRHLSSLPGAHDRISQLCVEKFVRPIAVCASLSTKSPAPSRFSKSLSTKSPAPTPFSESLSRNSVGRTPFSESNSEKSVGWTRSAERNSSKKVGSLPKSTFDSVFRPKSASPSVGHRFPRSMTNLAQSLNRSAQLGSERAKALDRAVGSSSERRNHSIVPCVRASGVQRHSTVSWVRAPSVRSTR